MPPDTKTNGYKPLGHRSYGHIAHLPGSRVGPGDHHLNPGQARFCCERGRDKHDRVIVQVKYDGGNVSAALLPSGELVALQRSGYLATSSPFEQLHLWAVWVAAHEDRFRAVLQPGERLCGEWLALAHGTRYDLASAGLEPFVAFDLMVGQTRAPFTEFHDRVHATFRTPLVLAREPTSIARVVELLDEHGPRDGRLGAGGELDPIEGAVWRVERHLPGKPARVDFLAKYVRPEKVDGCLLPEENDGLALWQWHPEGLSGGRDAR